MQLIFTTLEDDLMVMTLNLLRLYTFDIVSSLSKIYLTGKIYIFIEMLLKVL